VTTTSGQTVGTLTQYCAGAGNAGDPQCIAAGISAVAPGGAGSAASGSSGGSGGGGIGSGDGNAFSGTCAATTCSGDAIFCAMAQEQYKTDCADAAVDSTTQGVFNGLSGTGTAPSAGDSSFDVSGLLPAAPSVSACSVTDLSFTVGSGVYAQTLSMPFSAMCPYFSAIKAVVVAFGSLVFLLAVSGYRRG
jgi:hypothetical protein